MATYYCDITQATYSDATGADHTGNEYTGPAGLWAALHGEGNATALVAGDQLYVKTGTGDLTRLVWLDVDQNVSGWGHGDSVQNGDDDGGTPGAEWTGVVVAVSYATNTDQVLVWLASGKDETDIDTAEGIENTSAGGGANDPTEAGLDDVDTLGIVMLTTVNNGDTTDGNIVVRGVDSSWNTGQGASYEVTLDGGNIANDCWNLLGNTTRWTIQNFYFYDGNDDCFDMNGKSADYWILDHCRASDAGGDGFYIYNSDYSQMHHCVAHDNTGYAVYGGYTNWRYTFCHIYDNSGTGLLTVGIYAVVIGCLSHDNADDNFHVDSSRCTFFNCVGDGSTGGSGIRLDSQNEQVIIGCRWTNNNQYGIECDAAGDDTVREDYCVFHGNGVAARLNTDAGANSDDAPADDGFENAAGDDYNVKSGAEIRATAIDIDWHL